MTPAQIVMRRIDSLAPYERNARTHSPEQIKQIVASINKFGFTNPVLICQDGTIIAGHGRVEAAKVSGMEEVPTLTVGENWTPDDIRAYVLADNKLALNSGWDSDLLALELGELAEAGFDTGLIGFSSEELASILAQKTEGATDPDDIPEAPARPVSAPGDLWILGNHRIICGDSTSVETVERLLDGARPHLMVTDPPYGVNYDSTWRDQTGLTRSKQVAVGLVENDDRADWREAWALFPGGAAYVWHGALHSSEVADSLSAVGFNVRAQIIWAKQGFVFGRGHYHWQHEPCWYAVKSGASARWSGDRKQTTLWHIDNANKMKGGKSDDMTTGHGTQKPVECMKRPIENNSKPGDAVYEPFAGSFTTGIACEMIGRSCYAIELNPAYVDVAVERWQAFTGREATLEATGETFAQMRTQRHAAAA